MAYTKQTWVNNETLVDEDRMNHIENGIYQNAEDISEINQSLTDIDTRFPLLNGDNAISLESGFDLDDYDTCGTYYARNTTVANSGSNVPFSSAFILYVLRPLGGSNYKLQIFLAFEGRIYIRRYANSYGWGNWVTVNGSSSS